MGDRLLEALQRLGAFAAEFTMAAVPSRVRDRLDLMLLDHLAVTAAGATTPEGQRLIEASEPGEGPAPIVGVGQRTSVELAAWLNGTAVCSLELDEGNKYARGHPAAHAFPAGLAVAAARHVDGSTLAAALLAGYEVAARFGAATVLRSGVHPHGNWGVAGAAAAVSRLTGADATTTAAALDAAGALPLATPFSTVLDGNQARNAWMGHANVSGILAVRLARAGLAAVHGTARATLGGLLGDLDVDRLDEGLGERWLIERGYFKRHACCSYTHPPADAVLDLRAANRFEPSEVAAITVDTHHLAAGLDRHEAHTRLAAMFSIPYVVAVALARGDCAPQRFDDHHRADATIRRLMSLVEVRHDRDLDQRLPGERVARVTVRLRSGDHVQREVPNPVGDADHAPFGWPEVRAKVRALLAPAGLDPASFETCVTDLHEAPDVTPILCRV